MTALLWLVAAGLSPCFAQDASSTHAAVSGTVVNAMTHQPIARALVDLGGQAMLTDNEGRFSFSLSPEAASLQTVISARRPGYEGETPGDTTERQVFSLNNGGSSEISLALVPESVITGELLLPGDETGDSLHVQLLHQEIQNGRGHWSIFRVSDATSDGHFRFGNLPVGAYLVHIASSLDPAPASVSLRAATIRAGYVPVFYPNAREVAGAGVIQLAPGTETNIKMELTRELFYPVAIPVANPGESRGGNFEVRSDSFLGIGARFSPDDGLVHMELPSGHYTLEGHGYGNHQMSGQREFDVNNAPLRGPSITLLPVSRIPVSVHSAFTHTALVPPNTDATLTTSGQISIDLQPEGNRSDLRGPRASLQDEPSGSALVDATPGRYWVNARAFNGYIASMTSGGVDLLLHPLTVNTDGSASPIDVSLRDDFSTLSATLTGSLAPASRLAGAGSSSGLYLHLVPISGAGVAQVDAFSSDGTLNLPNLPPGTYLALASTSRREVEYRDPAVLAALEGRAQTLTLEPGASAHVNLDSLVDPTSSEAK